MSKRGACQPCQKRGKTWAGSDPVCAFANAERVFDESNWNCATMGELRGPSWPEDCPHGRLFHYAEDETLMVLPVPEDVGDEMDRPDEWGGGPLVIILGWYKRRGRVQTAYLASMEAFPVPLSERNAILMADHLRRSE